MELRPYPRLVPLFLGIILGNILQIVAHENQVSCNNFQYLEEELNKCCARCPPGQYRKEKCTISTETVCLPCGNRTYLTNWNYASSCRICYPCSQHLVEREPCSANKATVCGCPDGYSCIQHDAVGVCQICTPDEPPVLKVPEPTESPPDMRIIWIIIGVALFLVTAVVLILCVKTSLLKRFGRMIKNRRSSETTPQPETVVAVVVAVHGGPDSPLLKEIKMPLQEEGPYLNYPVEETDATQIGEFAVSK
ncbi:tumor necrosis factor receptor superfamily member 3 [Bufo bufo]|uniref:tumor necrosis factor receptor superfamily member 3 n=1 Tax=Bufo bufo TaxID=8384 RepID=UPI001ABEBC8C|nr:tumor necrosis factor receptor superfamily member 3 [Bufo bufo]